MQDINRDLLSAVREGDIKVVELLLQHGAKFDDQDDDGKTVLHLAVENAYSEESEYFTILKLLLQHGTKVDNQDKNGKTVLYHAVSNGCLKIVEEVLKYFPDINNESNRSSLEIAICDHREEYKKISEALLDYGFIFNPINADNPELLYGAVGKGLLTIIEDLFKYGADVNMSYEGVTPLHIAAKCGQEEAAKLLISYGADINARDEGGITPIFYANGIADSKITKLLLTNGANIKDCPKLLNSPANWGSIEIVKALLQHGTDVNARDENGLTALHFTAYYYAFLDNNNIKGEIAKLLLDKGANANAQDEDGTTTLHLSAKYGYQKIIKTLLKFGADVNFRDEDGRTALHFACEEGRLEVVETLLRYGPNINITSGDNYTALDAAIAGIDIELLANDEESTAHALKRHIVQMKTANLYVSEGNLLSLRRCDAIDLGELEEECEKEIVSMKSESINNTRISFYDILTKDIIFMANENIVQVLKSDDYKATFPKYASMIGSNFRKAMERRKLLEQSYKIFHFLINNLPELPYDCTEKIFSYLSNKDLQIFNDAGRNANEVCANSLCKCA